jgi:hypothetical protein
MDRERGAAKVILGQVVFVRRSDSAQTSIADLGMFLSSLDQAKGPASRSAFAIRAKGGSVRPQCSIEPAADATSNCPSCDLMSLRRCLGSVSARWWSPSNPCPVWA